MSERVSNKGKICSVEECEKPVYARDFCESHYARMRKYGDVHFYPSTRSESTECSIENCKEPATARGWCRTHYGRWRYHGDPLVAVRPVHRHMSPLERFEAQIDRNGPVPEYAPHLGQCWIWTGTTELKGYGAMLWNGRTQKAHRISYKMFVGDMEPGLVLDHLCRVRNCANPAHLEPVTVAENNRRGFGFSGVNAAKTHCRQGHEFTGENTYINPAGSRVCKICKRVQHKRHKQLKRFAKVVRDLA